MSSLVSLSCVTNEINDTNCIDSFQTTLSDPCGINASMCQVKIGCLHIITTSTDLLHKSPRLEWFLRQRVETKTRLKFAWAWDWVSGGWDLWFNFRLLLTNFQFCFPLENCSPANLNIYQSQSPIISHRRIYVYSRKISLLWNFSKLNHMNIWNSNILIALLQTYVSTKFFKYYSL